MPVTLFLVQYVHTCPVFQVRFLSNEYTEVLALQLTRKEKQWTDAVKYANLCICKVGYWNIWYGSKHLESRVADLISAKDELSILIAPLNVSLLRDQEKQLTGIGFPFICVRINYETVKLKFCVKRITMMTFEMTIGARPLTWKIVTVEEQCNFLNPFINWPSLTLCFKLIGQGTIKTVIGWYAVSTLAYCIGLWKEWIRSHKLVESHNLNKSDFISCV